MKLTAGKLRLAAWLVILSVTLVPLGMLMAKLAAGSMGGGSGALFGLIAYLLLTAINIGVLLIFRKLLNYYLEYLKANIVINSLIALAIIPPLVSMVSTQILTHPIGLTFFFLGMFNAALYTFLGIILIKNQVDLLGYSKKLGISTVVLYGTVILLAGMGLLMRVAAEAVRAATPSNWFILMYLVWLLCGVALVFFVVYLVRMFFAAARAVEAGREPETGREAEALSAG